MRVSSLLLAGAAAASADVHNVRAFGADGTGATPSTRAIHAALAVIAREGQGSLYFPPGIYHSAPFNLTSNTVLLLDDATLFAAKMQEDVFKVIPPLPSYGEGALLPRAPSNQSAAAVPVAREGLGVEGDAPRTVPN